MSGQWSMSPIRWDRTETFGVQRFTLERAKPLSRNWRKPPTYPLKRGFWKVWHDRHDGKGPFVVTTFLNNTNCRRFIRRCRANGTIDPQPHDKELRDEWLATELDLQDARKMLADIIAEAELIEGTIKSHKERLQEELLRRRNLRNSFARAAGLPIDTNL